MAKRAAKKQLSFLTNRVDEAETKSISVRVEQKLLNDFHEVAQIAETKGFRLTISDVVRQALQAAVDEAVDTFDVELGQEALPFEDDTAARPKRGRKASEGASEADNAS